MSGHSKWSTIKHGKAVTDARRGQLFTKLAKEIIIASKVGGGDPEMNFRLRIAVQRAKDNNMPAANIDRAINKGTGGAGESDQMLECTYEGYGPGGVGILLHALTDNKNRTFPEIKSIMAKNGGSLGELGCVNWMFEKKGLITISNKEIDEEKVLEFNKESAKSENIIISDFKFLDDSKVTTEEASKLLVQAFDFDAKRIENPKKIINKNMIFFISNHIIVKNI